jgi:hypothetical protein
MQLRRHGITVRWCRGDLREEQMREGRSGQKERAERESPPPLAPLLRDDELELQAKCELENARTVVEVSGRDYGGADLAEGLTGDVLLVQTVEYIICGQAKVWMVQRIERVRTKLQVDTLTDNRECLCQAKILIEELWTT